MALDVKTLKINGAFPALHHEDMVRAMRALLEAHRSTQVVRDHLEMAKMSINPKTPEGKEALKFILGVHRSMNHLTEAVADIPDEFWLLYLAPTHAGVAEVLKAMEVA